MKKHIVKPGEHLFQILRDYGISENEIPSAFNTTVSINPQLMDPNKLEPGQTVYIPLASHIGRDRSGRVSVTYSQARLDRKNTAKVNYEVRPGDKIVDLFREAGLSDKRIFDEYLQLFRELNPHIKNADRIEVGQRIIIPLPEEIGNVKTFSMNADMNATLDQESEIKSKSIVAPLHTKDSTETSTPAVEQNTQPSEKQDPITNKRIFVESILKIMGFRFTPGEEILYPRTENQWLKVNLEKTPLFRSPWGDQYAILPNSLRERQDEFEEILYTPIVTDDWEPKAILGKIEEKSSGRFKVWQSNHPLILNKGGLTLELNASLLVRMDKRIYLFNVLDPGEKPSPSLVQAFFSRKGIRISEWMRQSHAAPKPVTAPSPRLEDLYVPWIDRYNAWPKLKEHLTAGQEISPQGFDIDSVLTALKKEKMISREPLRLSWFPGQERELAVIVPATFVDNGRSTLALLSSNQASPHLVALLSLKGYGCLAVR
ncbi:MAG: LysM peptidoglycan-binding domain-containing protein [Desulfovibrionales bacterium]